MAVEFTPTYFNKRQYLYDVAVTSDKFNSDKFNALNDIDAQQANMFAEMAIGAKDKTSDTFNDIDYNRLNAEDSMLYLYNEFYQDKNETTTDDKTGETYNIYERNNEYLQYKIQEAIDQEIYDSLNGWEKFWATIGTTLASAGTEIYGALEGVLDATTLILGGVADISTAFQFHEQISEGTKEAISRDLTGVGYLREQINDITRKYTYIDKNTGWKIFNDVVVGIAQMAPLAINMVAPGVGTTIYYGSMAGRTAEETVITNPDIDLLTLLGYTSASVGVEALTEMLSDKIFGSPSAIDNLISGGNSVVRKGGFLRRIGMDMFTEGLEESVSEFADSVLDIIFLDPNAPLASINDILYAGLIGGLIGGIATGGTTLSTRRGFITKEGEYVTYKSVKEAQKAGINIEGTRLTRLQTIDLKSALSEATQKMRQSAVSDLQAKYSTLNLEEIKTQHTEEYNKAVAEDVKIQQSILDTTMALSKILQDAGAEGFAKATELAQYTVDQQSKFIRRFTEYSPSENAKIAVIESKINKLNPNSTATITEDLNSTQLKIRDAFKKMGIDLYFAQYGEVDGQMRQHEIVLDEKTVVMDADLFKNASYDYILDKVAKRSLVKTLQTQSGVLNKDALSRLKMLLFSNKAYDFSKFDDVKYLNDTQIDKLSDKELKLYADKQAEVLSQVLLFDELTVRKVFLGDNTTFKGVYKWLDKTKSFLEKFARKTDLNKVKYNSILKSMQLYENVIADTSLNEQYAQDAAKDAGMSPEIMTRIGERFNPTKHDDMFEHWAYIPLDTTKNQVDYINCIEGLHNVTNGKFSFRDAFNPNVYTQEFRTMIEQSMNKRETFQHALQRYLIKTYGYVIDNKHERIVEIMDFRNYISSDFDDALTLLADKSLSFDEFKNEFTNLGTVFNSEFNDRIIDEKTKMTLSKITLEFKQINRSKNPDLRGEFNTETNTITVYIDPTVSDLDSRIFELSEMEHTIYHETQHIIANWTNMYRGGNPDTMALGLSTPNNKNLSKNLWNKVKNITWDESVKRIGEIETYKELGAFVYANLAGEILAESTGKKTDITSVFGTNDYFDIQQDSENSYLVRGYGKFTGYMFQINYSKMIPIKAERAIKSKPLELLQGDTTSELDAIKSERYYINKVKSLIDKSGYIDSKTNKKYVSGVGDVEATNEAIKLLYSDNKYATTVKYVDEVITIGIPYMEVYKKLFSGKIDSAQSHTLEEITTAVDSEIKKQPELKKRLDAAFDKTIIVDRTTILNNDYDYSIDKTNQLLLNVKFTENVTYGRTKSIQEQIRGKDEDITFGETIEDVSPSIEETTERNIAQEKLNFDDAALAKVISDQIDTIQKNIDLPETFDTINAIIKYTKQLGEKDGNKIIEIFKQKNWLTKNAYVKRINNLVDGLKTISTLTNAEKNIINTDISSFESPLDFIEHTDALLNIKRNHKEMVSRETAVKKQSQKIAPDKKVFSDKTGFPKFDLYTEQDLTEQGMRKEYVKMSPEEYINSAFKLLYQKENVKENYTSWLEKQKRLRYELKEFGDISNVEYFKNKILSGEIIEMPYLDYVTKGQEGIHRAMAAQELGISTIDVAVMKKIKTPKKTETQQPLPSETIDTKQPNTIINQISEILKVAPTAISETKGYDKKTYEHIVYSDKLINDLSIVFTAVNDSNYEEIRNTLKTNTEPWAEDALNIFDYYCKLTIGKFSLEIQSKIDETGLVKASKAGSELRLQLRHLEERNLINSTVRTFKENGITTSLSDEELGKIFPQVKEKQKRIEQLTQEIKKLNNKILSLQGDIAQQTELLEQQKKASQEKMILEHGTNTEIADYYIESESELGVEGIKNSEEAARKLLEILINNGKLTIDGTDYELREIRVKENGSPTPFPKITKALYTTLKKLRSYRMWAMLSSPVTYVRNWISNQGMKVLEKATNTLERAFTKEMSDNEYAKLSDEKQIIRKKLNEYYKKIAPDKEQLEKKISELKSEKRSLKKRLKTATSEQKIELDATISNVEKNIDKNQEKLNELDKEASLYEKDIRGIDFQQHQLSLHKVKADKNTKQYVSETFGTTVDNILDGTDTKYLSPEERKTAKSLVSRESILKVKMKEAKGLSKITAWAQYYELLGLETGITGDRRVVKASIIDNFADILESNKEYFIRQFKEQLNQKNISTKKKELFKKAIQTQTVEDIVNALDSVEIRQLLDKASELAMEQYFKNPNVLSKWLYQLGKKHPAMAEIVSWVMPFPKVAANVLSMAYKYSPFGFMSYFMKHSQISQMKKGEYVNFTGFEVAEMTQALSRASVGTIALIAGVIFAALGWIDIDEDDYLGPALRIGDIKIGLSTLAPSMTTFSTAASVIWAWKNNKSAIETALNTLYDNTLLGNIENVFRYSSLQSYAGNQIVSLVGQYVPSVLKLINKSILNTPQKDKSGTWLSKLIKTTASYIPGISALVPNKTNPYTGEKVYASGSDNWFLNFIAGIIPVDIKYDKSTKFEIEAERVGAETTGLSGSFTINTKAYAVTGKEKEILAKYRANYLQNEYEKIINGQQLVTVEDENGKRITTTYNKLTDKQRANVLKSLYSKATDITKIKYWIDSGNVYYTSNKDEYNRLRKIITSGIYYQSGWSKSKFVER